MAHRLKTMNDTMRSNILRANTDADPHALRYSHVDMLTGEPIRCTAINAITRGSDEIGQSFEAMLVTLDGEFPVDYTRVRDSNGSNHMLNVVANINSGTQYARLDSAFAAILEVFLIVNPAARGTPLPCADALRAIRREAIYRPSNQCFRMWQIVCRTFATDAGKELRRIKTMALSLVCDHSYRLSAYIRALLSALEAHKNVDCTDPSIRSLAVNAFSSKDLSGALLDMATASLSMDCGVHASLLLDYRESVLHQLYLTHTKPGDIRTKVKTPVTYSLGGVDATTGLNLPIDLDRLECTLRDVEAEYRTSPQMLMGSPDAIYKAHLDGPAPDPTKLPSVLACVALQSNTNVISTNEQAHAVVAGSAKMASYYDTPSVSSASRPSMSQPPSLSSSALGPRHPDSAQSDGRSRNFRIFPMAGGRGDNISSRFGRGRGRGNGDAYGGGYANSSGGYSRGRGAARGAFGRNGMGAGNRRVDDRRFSGPSTPSPPFTLRDTPASRNLSSTIFRQQKSLADALRVNVGKCKDGLRKIDTLPANSTEIRPILDEIRAT